MKSYLFLLLTCISPLLYAQVKEELIYPVVPIADDCFYVFDDTSRHRIIPREDFLKIDKLYTTFNSCFGESVDTLFFNEYSVVFQSFDGTVNGMYYVVDGKLQSEYQSSLAYAVNRIKPYTTVLFSEIQYEKDGAKYQVAPFYYTIDSVVTVKQDTCWRFFPNVPEKELYSITIKKQDLKSLIIDSFGYNACTQKVEWIDTLDKAEVMTFSGDMKYGHYTPGQVIPSFQIHNKSNLDGLLAHIDTLRSEDLVDFRKLVYIKNGKYQSTPMYRFQIADDPRCYGMLDAEIPNLDSFEYYINELIKVERLDFPCLVNSQGALLQFDLKTYDSKKEKYSALSTSENGKMNRYMLFLLSKLSSEDEVIIENIKEINTSTNKKSNYKPIVITLP